MTQSANEVITRLMQAYGVHDESALAIHLGRDRHTLRVWINRDQVPLLVLSEASRATGYSVEWLRGEEGAEPSASTSPPIDSRVALTEREQSLIERYRATSDEGRAAVEVVTTTLASEPKKGRKPALASPTKGGGYLVAGAGAITARLVAREPKAPWRGAPVKPDTIDSGGGVSRARGALLPVKIASDSRPLVLSLSLGEAGAEADYELIPKFMGLASAGKALQVDDGDKGLDQMGDMAFSFEWLRDNLGHTSGQLASIKVRGDSMAGTLIDGETIIIDTAISRVDVSGIYVITVRGDRLVKRIDRKLDDSLVIISDNPRYVPDVLPPGGAANIQVMGRMVWPRVR